MAASATALLVSIDWAALPEEVRDDIRLLGPHIVDGRTTQTELAHLTGLPSAEVKRRLDDVRLALTASAFEHVDGLDPAARERLLVEVDALTKPR